MKDLLITNLLTFIIGFLTAKAFFPRKTIHVRAQIDLNSPLGEEEAQKAIDRLKEEIFKK